MTVVEFKKKWSRFHGKETSGYAEHFNDLCRLLGQATPVEADPSGNDFFCFQKGVIKDAELLEPDNDGSERPKKGFADVWKKDCFGWEYKGKHKNLDEAYNQLLRYRESLLNPPLLVVCDFDRFIVRTNFNGTVQDKYEFTNDQIDRPENLRILRALFSDPDFLKPQRTTAQVTEKVAGQMAEVARSLQNRESVELADAKSRKEVNVAQKKNLRIARFLNRIVFCFLPRTLYCCRRTCSRTSSNRRCTIPGILPRRPRCCSASWPKAELSAKTRFATLTAICLRTRASLS